MIGRSVLLSLASAGLITLAIGPLASAAETMASQDQQFVEKAAQGGKAEVELGKLAQEKAKNDDVKDFGEMMVEDHGDANDELKDIAEDQGFSVPDTMGDEAKEIYDQLSSLSGADFDRAYIDHMVKDHEKDVAAFEMETEEGENDELKDFAEETLPTLRKHLERARELQSELDQ